MFVRLHVRVRTYVCECELVVLILLPPLALLHCSVQASVCVCLMQISVPFPVLQKLALEFLKEQARDSKTS